MPGTPYQDATGQTLSDFTGTYPNVGQWSAVGDMYRADDGEATALSDVFVSPSGGFSSSSIGKRIVIFGAGPNTGVETLLREGSNAVATTSTLTVVSGTSLDCAAATKIVLSIAAATYAIKYSLYGGDASDYSDESLILGPTTVAAQSWDYQTVSSPTSRYYRLKVEDDTSGNHGTVYTTIVAFGYALGTTITAVSGPTTVTLADAATSSISSAKWFYGTDHTTSLQAALDSVYARLNVSGGDGGGSLYIAPGQYLISGTIVVPKKIELYGANMAASAIFADPSVWNDGDYMVKLGDATDYSPAISCRISDLRLNGNWANCSGVYSQQAQESSGVFRCSIVGWRYKGIRFYYYGCQHWTLEKLWMFPSSTAIDDTSVVGIELEQTISSNPINQATVYGQGGYSAGKGTGIRVLNCNVAISDVHIENALKGIHFDTGSNGTVSNFTGHPLVDSGTYITTTNDVAVMNSSANGSKNNIYDNVSASAISDARVSQYLAGPQMYYFRGPNNSTVKIAGWVPGSSTSGKPSSFIDGRGNFATDGANNANPNVVTLDAINFGGPAQGGFLSVNSRPASYPNWEQTSTSASTVAMFMRLAASLFEVRFGSAANTQGTDPGTSALSVDTNKTILNRLWFQYGQELNIGNDSGAYRLRLTHQDTGQAHFMIQRSQDSGSTWADAMKFHLDLDKLEVIGDIYLHSGLAGIIVFSGDPEGVVSAGPGSLGLGTDGELWFKTDTGTTGWIGVGGTDIKAQTLTIDGPHPAITFKKSGVQIASLNESGQLSIDSASPSVTIKNGGNTVFSVDADGNTVMGIGKLYGPTGSNPFEVYINNVLVLSVSPLGVLNVSDFIVGSGGQALINGDIILNNGTSTGGKLIRTNASTLALEEVSGVSSSQAFVESVSHTLTDPIPNVIDTTGMTGDSLTIATAVNAFINALGAGGTVVKSASSVDKTATLEGGAITAIA